MSEKSEWFIFHQLEYALPYSTWLSFITVNLATHGICFICDLMKEEYSYLYCDCVMGQGPFVDGSIHSSCEMPNYIKEEITQYARETRLDGVDELQFYTQIRLCKECTHNLYEPLRQYAKRVLIEEPGFLSSIKLQMPEDNNQRFSKTKSARK